MNITISVDKLIDDKEFAKLLQANKTSNPKDVCIAAINAALKTSI